jgi:hypothetical protein
MEKREWIGLQQWLQLRLLNVYLCRIEQVPAPCPFN